MTNRREFLQIGLVASALPGLLQASSAAAAAPAVPLYKVLFDERFAAGRAFGAQAARLGASTIGFSGDITDFWFNDLDLRWRHEAVAVSGFTRHGPMFVLERLAWDRGMKVVFRAEHHPLSSGAIEHRLTCEQPSIARAVSLIDAGQDWSRIMAAIVTQCAAGSASDLPRSFVTRTGQHEPDDEPFYTWVIARKA